MKEFLFLLFISCFLFGPALILSDDHPDTEETEQVVNFELDNAICHTLPTVKNENLCTMRRTIEQPLKVTNAANENKVLTNRNIRQKAKEKVYKQMRRLEEERRDRHLQSLEVSFDPLE